MPGSVAVDIEELVVRYGTIVAVDHLSLQARAGEVFALLGPNGAGKTSTIEVAEGYRRPTSGRVRVLGLDPVRQHGELVRRMGVMLQSGGVYPGIRAIEAVQLFTSLYGSNEDPRALLDRVGLGARARSTWRQLSGGEQQRLSLALALVGRPEVVFLDEPTSGVDVSGRQLVRAAITEAASSGCCVVVTTHELAEAERVADRVAIIDHGRLLALGTPEELTAADDVRFSGPPGLDVAALGQRLGVAVEEIAAGHYRIGAPASPALVADLAGWMAEQGLALDALQTGRRSLEDVFLRLTGGDPP